MYFVAIETLLREIFMSELPLAPIRRIIDNAGAKRVATDGIKALAEALEEYGACVADKAVKICRHVGRKTVKAGDIKISA